MHRGLRCGAYLGLSDLLCSLISRLLKGALCIALLTLQLSFCSLQLSNQSPQPLSLILDVLKSLVVVCLCLLKLTLHMESLCSELAGLHSLLSEAKHAMSETVWARISSIGTPHLHGFDCLVRRPCQALILLGVTLSSCSRLLSTGELLPQVLDLVVQVSLT